MTPTEPRPAPDVLERCPHCKGPAWYSHEHDNFYCANEPRGLGQGFWERNRYRKHNFPKSQEAAALSPSPSVGDARLADEIERWLDAYGTPLTGTVGRGLTSDEWRTIIAALRASGASKGGD